MYKKKSIRKVFLAFFYNFFYTFVAIIFCFINLIIDLNRIFFTFLLFVSGILATKAQSSVSFNYVYLGGKEKRAADVYEGTIQYFDKVSKGLTSHGAGIQGKIHLKPMTNQMIIMPDIGYFFEEYEKVTVTGTHLKNAYRENKLSCIAVNLNIGYNILDRDPFSLVFLAGPGYFRENIWSYCFSEGEMQQTDDPTFIPKHAISEKLETGINAFVVNLGFIGEVYLTKNIFANVGLKFAFDFGDTRFNSFPLTVGVGYSFGKRR